MMLATGSTPCANTTTPKALATLTWTNLAAQSAEQISLAAVPIVAVIALNAGPARSAR